jgi:lipoyl(octanoyl) transferase
MQIRYFDHPEPYEPILEQMRFFTRNRTTDTEDELWCLEHTPVFTLGQAGNRVHLLVPTDIPVVQSCRGGQITYHGPGQLVVYTLVDLTRLGLDVRQFVRKLENTLIEYLKDFGLCAHTESNAPGVYIHHQKIASLGLRVRMGRCYHGLSLNVNMDLTPFQMINPCGYPNLKMIQLSDFEPSITIPDVKPKLLEWLLMALPQPSVELLT